MASSASDSDLAVDNGSILSPALAQASLNYMRSSGPESSPGNIIGSKAVFVEAPSSDSGSLYLLSCPPSWLFQDARDEHDNLQPEVPLSSSPPDITNSSPQSFGSRESEKGSSSATSAYSASLSTMSLLRKIHLSLTSYLLQALRALGNSFIDFSRLS